MKKKTKLSLIGVGFVASVIALSSCTASFCSNADTAKIMYTFERGVTRYYDADAAKDIKDAKPLSELAAKVDSISAFDTNKDNVKDNVFTDKLSNLGISADQIYYVSSFDNSKILRDKLIPALKKSNYLVPSLTFFELIDAWTLLTTLEAYETPKTDGETPNLKEIVKVDTITKPIEGYDNKYKSNYDQTTLYGVLNRYGYRKFYKSSDNELFIDLKNQIDLWRNNPETVLYVPGFDYVNAYQSVLKQETLNYRSCISTVGEDSDIFGMYGDPITNGGYEQIEIDKKDWGYAWSKGLFEGLLIFPISWVVDSITYGFSGGNAGLINGNGWAQVGAILLVTIILRALIMLASLKTTLGQAKMQKIQPQLAKLQEKYPNANTNQYEKQRLAQEQMALYKKNKISPFGQIIVMIIQFPVFICVWGALSGSSALSTGTFYNMNLADTVWNVLTNTNGLPGNVNGWWTAFVLIILMTIFQVAATIVPLIIQKIQRKKVEKLGKNQAVAKQNKTMKIVQFVMLAMIVVMGFTLPAAMGVYWIAGAIFSLSQTTIMYFVNNKKDKKPSNNSKKTSNKKDEVANDKVVLEVKPIEEVEEKPTTKPNQNKNKNNQKQFKYPKKRGGRR